MQLGLTPSFSCGQCCSETASHIVVRNARCCVISHAVNKGEVMSAAGNFLRLQATFRRFFLRGLALCIVAMLGATFALAQITTTTVVGTVTDNTGAAVAGATVTVTNTDTNLVRTTKSSDDGAFRIEFLPVGHYKLEAAFTGFKTFVQQGIV